MSSGTTVLQGVKRQAVSHTWPTWWKGYLLGVVLRPEHGLQAGGLVSTQMRGFWLGVCGVGSQKLLF